MVRDRRAGRSQKRTSAPALATWDFLGPGNIGGRTRTLVIHPDQPEIMYAGGVSGGVWKTVDGGVSWVPVADELANIAVNSMAMHPENHDTLYVGTGEGYFREVERGTWLPLQGAGIFRTDDGAATWSVLPSTTGEDFFWVNDIVFSPRDPERIYAATRTGVHISEDGGDTWAHVLDPDVNGGCLDLALRTDKAVDWVFASCGTFDQATDLPAEDDQYRRVGGCVDGTWDGADDPRDRPLGPEHHLRLVGIQLPRPGRPLRDRRCTPSIDRSNGGSPGSWRSGSTTPTPTR